MEIEYNNYIPKYNAYININNDKRYIKTQDWFTYRLIKHMYKNLIKNNESFILENLFEYDELFDINKFNGDIENPRYIHEIPKKYRTDLEFTINNNSIIIEFCENQHNPIDEYEHDTFRLWRISNKFKNVKACWIFLKNY